MEPVVEIDDRTRDTVRRNLARIRLVTVAGPILREAPQRERVLRLLQNRCRWGIEPPLVMLAVHDDDEAAAAASFAERVEGGLARCTVVRQQRHNQTVGNAIALFRREFDRGADPFAAKRQSLFLTRRGGKGTPTFVSPFLGGQGTTCGEWTRPMVRRPMEP